jgi:ubiquinone/menaquinone biosynthesis C-methylase UbiE
MEGNAEHLPYANEYFQAVTNVFLLHELPNPIRQKVIQEFYRVLQSGGILVIADSIQESDSPEFKPMMENFPLMFHEPFYTDYIKDNIVVRLDQAGFVDIEEKVHSFSKYWIAKKP